MRTEQSLIDSENSEQRRALCRLRISARDLQFERGRYSDIAKEKRKRTECGKVENQLRFPDHGLQFANSRSINLRVSKCLIQI